MHLRGHFIFCLCIQISKTKLDEELHTVLGDSRIIPTIFDVPKLAYTERILTESMRLYPPAWALGRQAIKEYKIDKYTIRAGSIILMSQYVMHRNPLYFTDPESFLSRPLDSGVQKTVTKIQLLSFWRWHQRLYR